MVRNLAWGVLAVLGLAGCEAPFVAVSPQDDQRWAQQRRLCLASPQMGHCDVYLRNAIPPAPYTTDGILIEQRRLCFQTRSIADCSAAQRMGRDATTEATGQPPSPSGPPTQAEEADDEYAPAPAATNDASSTVLTEPMPAPAASRSRRRAAAGGATAPCTPAVLESLDLVDAPTRAAILRRCASVQR
jgi:hypothetical protein